MSARRVAWTALAALLLSAAVGYATGQLPPTESRKPIPGEDEVALFKGTWTGTSKCLGDHPACKDEIVVYRFVPFVGAPWQLRVLADKIIDGKRQPMGALMFLYDRPTHTMRCEFTRPNAHGIWSFAAQGDSLVGQL
ncbi:MAG TPA: hypothetical protein VFH88_08425, partial [Candidatus Krumholzibacteria bacterium]|nr:hypothetical protein [Candidatus Krumholzibacteria bacterium]